jgi:hypothetical protein
MFSYSILLVEFEIAAVLRAMWWLFTEKLEKSATFVV